MKKLLGWIFNRWLLLALLLVALSLVLWIAGPLLAVGEVRPLETERARAIAIVVLLVLVALRIAWGRWRARRGLPLTLFPKFFPYDVSLADRIVLAIVARGEDPAGFIGEVLADVWAREQDMSRPELVLAAAERARLATAGLIESAGSEATSQAYQAAIAEAVEAGVFGAPSYVLDGEIFWGQDRLDLLADALASGRAAYRHDATT